MGIPPGRILYVGDSYECDVLGANRAGMISALVLRKDYHNVDVEQGGVFTAQEIAQQRQQGNYADAHVVLPSLRVRDLEAVFGEYFSGKR